MKKCIKNPLIIIFIFLIINHINSSGVDETNEADNTENRSDNSSQEIRDEEKTENESDNPQDNSDNQKTENGSDKKVDAADIMGQDESLELQEKDNDNSPNEDLNEKKCLETEPSKGIIDDCVKGNEKVGENTCCYLELKYSYNSYYGCLPLNKDDLKSIKNRVKELKEELKADSAKIKCKSSFIQLQMLLILLICLNLIF